MNSAIKNLNIMKNVISKNIKFPEKILFSIDKEYFKYMRKSKEYLIICSEEETINGVETFLNDYLNYFMTQKKICLNLTNELNIKKFVTAHRFNQCNIYNLYYLNYKNEMWCRRFNFELIEQLNENIIMEIINLIKPTHTHYYWDIYTIVDILYNKIQNTKLKENFVAKISQIKSNIYLNHNNNYKISTLLLLSQISNIYLINKYDEIYSFVLSKCTDNNKYSVRIDKKDSVTYAYNYPIEFTFEIQGNTLLSFNNQMRFEIK